MNRATVGDIARALPAVTHVVQWGASDVYKVGGKVFAIVGDDGVSFKVSPVGFAALTEGGPGRQAAYCAKGHWVNVSYPDLSAADARDWLPNAHALIAAKLTRKTRAELGLG
jgi:predicted DNA-binding protein (MmcQ/YjbR family)